MYDPLLNTVVESAEKGLKSDDDFFIICAGDTGTGKTRLMFHAYDKYAGELATIAQVALNQRDFSEVIDRASKVKIKAFAGFDEGNVNRREAMTKWNRKTIDLYLNIRGLNIFHWWNNPSIEMLDKPFIEERVKGVIYILTKDKNKPRLYYYFTKEGILNLLDDKGNIKGRTIKKYGHQYAFYLGWFKDYHGPLLDDYKKMKSDRMIEKVQEYVNEFAPTEKISMKGYAKKVDINHMTARHMFKYGVEAGHLKEGEHYIYTGAGEVKLLAKGIEGMDYIRINESHKKRPRSLGMKLARNKLLTASNTIYSSFGGAT